jgi:3'-5' exoribonuclease
MNAQMQGARDPRIQTHYSVRRRDPEERGEPDGRPPITGSDAHAMLNLTRLKLDDPVEGNLLVSEKQLNRTKDGKPFLRLTLMNHTGSIEGTLWNGAEEAARDLCRGQVVLVQGRVISYQQELKINLRTLSPVREEDLDKTDFLPASTRDPAEMAEELHRTIRGIGNPFLRRLMEAVFRDPDIWERFSTAPAAKSMHHAFLGGLLEHSLSLAGLARTVSRYYPFLDADLLTVGALVHDLGKAWEISSDLGFDYTDEGRLLGHIQIGIRVLEKKVADIPEFPPPLALHLKHIVGSHHGEPGFGALKPPMTLEAVCLHQLDNLDAKLNGIREFLEKATPENEQWSSYHRVHQQYFFLPESYGSPPPPDDGRKRKPDPDTTPDLFER